MASREPDDPLVRNKVSGSWVNHLIQTGAVNRDLNIHYGTDSPRGHKLRATADDLADTISKSESTALAQLLGEVGAPRPANITFDRLALIQWRADGSDQTGDLNQISDYYRALRHGRLVVVGDPGSGKTVLAVHLVRQLLRVRPGTTCPVPVRLGLSSFHPFLGPENRREVTDLELADRLDAWLVDKLVVDHNVRRGPARELVRRRWILPVLDGLDEMDAGTEPPDHAAAVVRALNADDRPFVLTSRCDRYDQLLGHTSIEPTLPQDATTVILQPLAPAVVRDYLTYLFPDPTHSSGIVAHWRATADALGHATPERPDPLITALCSPWQLYLCRTAFASPDRGDPYEHLSGLASDELTDELMGRLIPAAVRHHRSPDGNRYTADQVTTWLTTLARCGTDILLHELWRVTGPRLSRHLSATVLTLLMMLLTLLGAATYTGDRSWLVVGTTITISMIALTGYRMTRRSVAPNRLEPRCLVNRRGRRKFVFWFVAGPVIGLVLGQALALAGFEAGVATMLAATPVVACAWTLAVGIASPPSMISAPRELVRQGLIHDFGIALAIMVAATFAPIPMGETWPTQVAPFLAFGLAGGLILAIAPGPSPWPRYFMATLLLRSRHELPLRPALFLDWAYTAGLVRLSGIAIQFRHDTFRAWLAQQDDLRLGDPAEPRRSRPPGR